MEAYSHILSWCRHSIFGFFLPIYVSFFKRHSVIFIGYQEVMVVIQLSNRHQLSCSRHLRSG